MANNFQIKFLLLTFFITSIIQATGQEVIKINKLINEVDFDGIPNEELWQSATEFPMIMYSPTFGSDPGEVSKVMIGYDDNYFWIGAILEYSDPAKIISTSKKRDEESKSSDSFGILLDTYDDNENALAFFTMPAGQRIDYSVSNDAMDIPPTRGSTNLNYSWNTFWDVKTNRIPNGWALEMRIPFSSLRFQEVDGRVRMGLILNRSISYCNEIDTYPLIDPKYGRLAPQKPSLAQTIELRGIQESKPVYISPYVIGGTDGVWELNNDETKMVKSTENTFNGGVDLKYSLTSNLTMDLTVNTDFAQVEADDERVNLTRYSLFYPEKRMFFQERSSIFDFSLGRTDQLFYSRKIGLDAGTPVPILGGARLTGRVGKWDMGMLDMQTKQNNDVQSENFGVMRFRRQVINENSYIGAIFTSRIGENSNNYFSYGVDGIVRIFGDDYVQLNIAQTTDTLGNNFTASPDASFISLSWERRSDRGFAYELSTNYIGTEFDPRVGFLSRNGIKSYRVQLKYGWLPGVNSKLFSYNFSLFVYRNNRIFDDGLERAFYGPTFSFMTKSGWRGRFDLNYNQQGVDFEYVIADDVYVPEGLYSYFSSRANLSTPTSKPVSCDFSFQMGQFYDGNNFTATAEPTFNFSSSFQLSGYYNYNHVSFPLRSQDLNAHIGRLKLLYMYNTKLSASTYIQYNSVNNISIANFRLRYNPKEGNDLYLVYNEIRPIKGYFSEGVIKSNFLNRSFQIKYIHTFRL